jgi:OmpA-OmpF porin, OOP family
MKKNFLAAILGTVIVLPLAAHAEGAYIGVNISHATQKLSADAGGSLKETDTGYKLYGGTQLTKNFGVEVGYVDLGDGDTSASDGINTVSISAKPKSLYLAAVGTLPLNEQLSLFAKAGVSANRTKVTVTFNGTSDSDTEKKTTAMFGVGASYNFTKNFSLVGEYENFGDVIKDDGVRLKADMLSLGIRYTF